MIINGMPDHIHVLVGTKPNCNLSDLVRDIKANSSKWINEKRFKNHSNLIAFTGEILVMMNDGTKSITRHSASVPRFNPKM